MSNINSNYTHNTTNSTEISFITTFDDVENPSKVAKEIARLLFIHREQREELKTRERERVVISQKHDKNRREAYIKHSKTSSAEKMKNILVEIDTEQDKNDLDIVEQKIKELTRNMSSIKLEIDAWKTIIYNVRTEMGYLNE